MSAATPKVTVRDWPFRRVEAVGKRYRIIYKAEREQVVILLAGIRKDGDKHDVYALAKKLMKQGLLK